MSRPDLLMLTDSGLFCAKGGFFIDPWESVDRAVITHAHSDHARSGCGRYLAARDGVAVLATRIGLDAVIDTVVYGDEISLGGVRVSLHPAGHVLGSAQVRVESEGEVWVVSGDYKIARDATCAPFEPLKCDVFITESTFGLPIFRWPDQESVFADINGWWRQNVAEGRASVVYVYALGKAQRLLSGLDLSIGPVYCHGAVHRINEAYRQSGAALPDAPYVGSIEGRHDWSKSLILAPPSTRGSTWLRRFGDFSSGYASGWMQIRGMRRRRTVDRGFVLSDHADWPGLLEAIRATGAPRVLVTHGSVGPMVRWLTESGLHADGLATKYEGELEEAGEAEEVETGDSAADAPAAAERDEEAV